MKRMIEAVSKLKHSALGYMLIQGSPKDNQFAPSNYLQNCVHEIYNLKGNTC